MHMVSRLSLFTKLKMHNIVMYEQIFKLLKIVSKYSTQVFEGLTILDKYMKC